jgi:hypothetical protein
MRAFRPLLPALAAGLAGCGLFNTQARVTFATDPPGARVLIDQRDSGFVTPCVLALPRDDLRVDLVYPGYETATRLLTPNREIFTIFWEEMYIRSVIWKFPLWLNTKDFWAPIKIRSVLSPNRLYVRLDRTADAT